MSNERLKNILASIGALALILLFIQIFGPENHEREAQRKMEQIEHDQAIWEAAYEEGYSQAEWELRDEYESKLDEFEDFYEGELEHAEWITREAYRDGYAEGYGDCMVEHGLTEPPYTGEPMRLTPDP